jgi:Zn finger protein HypA/HybF involved in hydrogenase expression
MHEYGIARDIVWQALAEAERCGAERIATLHLKVGPDVVDLEALSFGILAAAHGTVAEGVAVEIMNNGGPGIVLASMEVTEAADVCGSTPASASEN